MNDEMITNDEMNSDSGHLEHYQIKGAKHGVRNYQNPDGSLTPAGRERYGVGPPRGSKEARQKQAAKLKAKQEKAEKKAAKKEKSEAEEKEALMKYLRSHPKQVYKHRLELTEDDAKKLIEQIDFDRKLKDVRDAEVQRGWDTLRRVSDRAGTVSSLLNNSKSIYNTTAEIHNMLIDSGKLSGDRMTKIGGNPNPQPQQNPNQPKNNP